MSTTALQPADHARRIEELGRIIMAYSEVTEKLQQSHDQLKETVQTLRSELSEKNRLLERRNRLAALGEMAAGMAHEIRNPLGGIQLYSSMLAKDVVDRPESLRTVQKISAGVKRLEALVTQVLQFTREMSASIVEMDLADIIEQSVELAGERFKAKQIDCEIDGPRPLAVLADPLLIGQAVLNLILNAADAIELNAEVNASEANSQSAFRVPRSAFGRVSITFCPPPTGSDAKQFHLVIRDTGPGIPANILDKIFNPFFTTKDTGTGLGLAIVHRVVEAHDGTIIVTNPPEGGARFEIRI